MIAVLGWSCVHVLEAASPPSGKDGVRTILEDVSYRFTPDDFGFSDSLDQPPDRFMAVRLASAPSAGVLSIEGVRAGAGSLLSFVPWPGRTWEARETVRNWGSVACSSDGATVVAGTFYGGLIYVSHDRGATWTVRDPVGGGGTWHDLALSGDGRRMLCAGGQSSLYVSGDGGETWVSRGPNATWLGAASSADGMRLVAAPYPGLIHVSTDGGATWIPRGASADWSDVASSADGMRLVASRWNGPLVVSADGGETWTERESARLWTAASVSEDGMKCAATVRDGQIWLSDDGGVSWRSTGETRTWIDIVSSRDGEYLVAGVEGGMVFTSSDRGQTWIARETNRTWMALALAADSRELWGAEFNGRLHYSPPQPAEMVFQSVPEESGRPYASFRFQVADSGPDGANLDLSPNVFSFDVTPVDDRPVLAMPLPDQAAAVGNLFQFTIDPGSFVDPDAGTTLVFSAVRADGGPLPTWLTFDPVKQSFTGVPAAEDRSRMEIVVTATDPTGLAVMDTFALEVAGLPQGAAGSITLEEETSYTFTSADFPFADSFDTPPDTLTRVRITTVPAIGSLRLNGNPVANGDVVPLVPTPGNSWTRRTTLAGSSLVSSADASRLLAIRTPIPGPSVYRSLNGGQTWVPVPFFDTNTPTRPTCAATSADGSRWAVASQDGGRIYVSADYGQTWAVRGLSRNWSALASSADGSRLLAVDFGAVGGGLPSISTDYGSTWKTSSVAFALWVAAVSSADGMKLAVASASASNGPLGSILTSSDGGVTWLGRSPHADWSALASSGDGERLAAASSNGLFLSDDAGATWRQVLVGSRLTSVTSSSDGRTLVTTASNGRIFVSLDRGVTWAAAGETADWMSVVSSSDGQKLAASGSSGIFTSLPTMPLLVYTPPENGAGSPYTTLTFQVGDSGPAGLNLDPVARTLAIDVTNVNDPPVLAEPLPTQIVPPSTTLNYQISETAFSDPDPGDRLAFGATLDDDQPLPFWLNFNASTRTVTAVADVVVPGTYRLRITASDQGAPPGQTQALLRLTFLSEPPVGADTAISLNEDAVHRFTPSDFSFSDPGDTPPNALSRILLESVPEKGALSIDGISVGVGEYVSFRPDARMAWTQQASRKSWEDIAMSADGSRVAAVWGNSGQGTPSTFAGEIMLSADGGTTWTASLPGRYWSCVAMSPDGTKMVAAARENRLAVSRDSGQSWIQRGVARDWVSVAVSQDGAKMLAAPVYGELSVSLDGGLTWAQKLYILPWSKVAMSDDGSVMAAAGPAGLWISQDAGATWTVQGLGESWASVVLSSDGERVAALNGEQFRYSDDFGATWEHRGPSLTWTVLAGSSDLTRLVAVDRFSGRPYVSPDAGFTWTPKERRNNWVGLASSDDGSLLAATAAEGFIFTSADVVSELVFKPGVNGFGLDYARFSLRVGDTGTPGSNLAATATAMRIDIVPVNDAPVVALPIADRTATEKVVFSYAFSAGVFTDAEDGTSLVYEATLATGAPLPGWLKFDAATRTLAGIPGPPDTGVIDVMVTARDSAVPPLAVSDTFQLIVRNVEEPPAGTSATLMLAKNVPWIFSASDFGFSDPLDVPPSALARVKLTTLPAAGVLSVDGVPAAAESFVRLTPSLPGAVWSPRGSTASWWAVCSSDDGNQLAAVVNGARIHTSADAGVTWTARESNRGWYAIASSADGRRLAAVVQGGLIYTSDDAGVNWVPRASPRAWRAIASSADGSRLVALESPGLIYVSSDFGATWAPRESSRAWYSIASSADGTKLAAVVQNGTIFTSDTAGDEWVPRETVRNWRAITSSADGLKLAAVEQNGLIYTSPNAGLTWVGREAARDWHSITSSADGSRLAAVVRDGRIYHSQDAGVTWIPRATNGFWRAIASSADGNRLVAVAPGNKIFTSAIAPAQSLVFTPEVNASGSPYASFTFQVEDDGAPNVSLDPTPDTMTLVINDSNVAPTLDPVADVLLAAAGAGGATVQLSGISAGGGASQALVVSAVSSHPDVVPHPVVTYSSPAAVGSLTVTPAPGATGNAIITVTVRDSGGTANGGIDQIVRTFTVSLMTPFQEWAQQNGRSTDPTAAGGMNFFAYAFGLEVDGSETGPLTVAGGLIQQRGMPALQPTGGANPLSFSALFGRRKNSGLDYQVQFSSDFSDWETSLAPMVPAGEDAVIEAFSVPFPARLASGRVPRFFRIKLIGR